MQQRPEEVIFVCEKVLYIFFRKFILVKKHMEIHAAKYSLLFLATYAFALPINPNFVPGSAKLELINVNELKIDVSHNSVIEWDDFSILENERVEFCQPGSDSSVLNRVVMPNPSHIFGTLKANGNVIIINPHGIVFGEHAQIDIGSLVAAVFDLQTDVNSQTKYFTSSALIQHFGSVQARGDVVLFAKELKNLGQITSNYGSIDLISDPNFFSENYHDLIATEDFVVNQTENTLFNNGLISIKSSGQTELCSVDRRKRQTSNRTPTEVALAEKNCESSD